MQVMHGGRVSHTAINGTDRIVAPSAIAVEGEAHTAEGKLPYPVPHALTTDGGRQTRDAFVAAARRAVDAGLDGVELHGANGYLLHEFLAPGSNQRDDQLRRLARRTASASSSRSRRRSPPRSAPAGSGSASPRRTTSRTSSRPTPPTSRATYGLLVDALRPLGLAYLSVLHADPRASSSRGCGRASAGTSWSTTASAW